MAFMEFYNVDFFDIALVSCVLYFLMQHLRTSRALAVLIGLILLRILYYISGYYGLYTLYWILSHVFDSLFILIVVIFQPDIRKALVDIGNMAFFKTRFGSDQGATRREVVDACMEMARKRQGALIVFERSVSLNDIIDQEGQKIDAQISRRLLMNIFYVGSPLHDGAVIISHGRLAAAGCILPLAVAKDQNFGTRHRAALGITLDSDAAVIVVSEERGEISLAHKGVLTRKLERSALEKILNEIL
ncbi:MAG: diadenylate cyclase CdaA [Desulfovibrionaceae bacterium]|nr:diadenylate cyclase CdaA [Desulfovibrionaceae bacterium]